MEFLSKLTPLWCTKPFHHCQCTMTVTTYPCLKPSNNVCFIVLKIGFEKRHFKNWWWTKVGNFFDFYNGWMQLTPDQPSNLEQAICFIISKKLPNPSLVLWDNEQRFARCSPFLFSKSKDCAESRGAEKNFRSDRGPLNINWVDGWLQLSKRKTELRNLVIALL